LPINESADVNAKSRDGTPLDWAIVGFEGKIPLHRAIRRIQAEIADLLRKHGGKTGEELKAEGK